MRLALCPKYYIFLRILFLYITIVKCKISKLWVLRFQDAFTPADSSIRPDNCCESGIVSVWHNLNSDCRQVDCQCPRLVCSLSFCVETVVCRMRLRSVKRWRKHCSREKENKLHRCIVIRKLKNIAKVILLFSENNKIDSSKYNAIDI